MFKTLKALLKREEMMTIFISELDDSAESSVDKVLLRRNKSLVVKTHTSHYDDCNCDLIKYEIFEKIGLWKAFWLGYRIGRQIKSRGYAPICHVLEHNTVLLEAYDY